MNIFQPTWYSKVVCKIQLTSTKICIRHVILRPSWKLYQASLIIFNTFDVRAFNSENIPADQVFKGRLWNLIYLNKKVAFGMVFWGCLRIQKWTNPSLLLTILDINVLSKLSKGCLGNNTKLAKSSLTH